MSTEKGVPAGYRADSKGRLVPTENISDADLAADDLVAALFKDIEFATDFIARLKGDLLDRVAEHVRQVGAHYGVNIEGRTGSVVLTSYDGLRKIERTNGDRTKVGPQIHAAEALVREFLEGEQASQNMRLIADRAFRRNAKTGELNVARLLDLINVAIDDDLWRRAQLAVREALTSDETVTYFRAYRRDRVEQPWQQVPLDFSGIRPVHDDVGRFDPADPADPAEAGARAEALA